MTEKENQEFVWHDAKEIPEFFPERLIPAEIEDKNIMSTNMEEQTFANLKSDVSEEKFNFYNVPKDEAKKSALERGMCHLANSIYIAGMLLKPVLVKASDKLFAQLGVDQDLMDYNNVYNYGCVANHVVNKGDQLFPRLDAAVEVPFIASLMGENK